MPDLANGGDDLSDAKDFAARVFVQPFKTGTLRGLGVGVGGEHRHRARHHRQRRASRSIARPGQQTLFRYRSGRHYAGEQRLRRRQARPPVAAGLLLHRAARPPRRVRHLPQRSHPCRRRPPQLEHKAWEATGSFFLTGEKAGFRSPAPKRPFDLKEGGFGAVELVARYGELTPDEASFPVYANPRQSAEKAKAWGVGRELALHAGGQGRA